jgi:hypothetical protein
MNEGCQARLKSAGEFLLPSRSWMPWLSRWPERLVTGAAGHGIVPAEHGLIKQGAPQLEFFWGKRISVEPVNRLGPAGRHDLQGRGICGRRIGIYTTGGKKKTQTGNLKQAPH